MAREKIDPADFSCVSREQLRLDKPPRGMSAERWARVNCHKEDQEALGDAMYTVYTEYEEKTADKLLRVLYLYNSEKKQLEAKGQLVRGKRYKDRDGKIRYATEAAIPPQEIERRLSAAYEKILIEPSRENIDAALAAFTIWLGVYAEKVQQLSAHRGKQSDSAREPRGTEAPLTLYVRKLRDTIESQGKTFDTPNVFAEIRTRFDASDKETRKLIREPIECYVRGLAKLGPAVKLRRGDKIKILKDVVFRIKNARKTTSRQPG